MFGWVTRASPADADARPCSSFESIGAAKVRKKAPPTPTNGSSGKVLIQPTRAARLSPFEPMNAALCVSLDTSRAECSQAPPRVRQGLTSVPGILAAVGNPCCSIHSSLTGCR